MVSQALLARFQKKAVDYDWAQINWQEYFTSPKLVVPKAAENVVIEIGEQEAQVVDSSDDDEDCIPTAISPAPIAVNYVVKKPKKMQAAPILEAPTPAVSSTLVDNKHASLQQRARAKKEFAKQRDALLQHYFAEFNRVVFNNRLPKVTVTQVYLLCRI